MGIEWMPESTVSRYDLSWEIIRFLEEDIGESIYDIMDQPLCERRREVERRFWYPMILTANPPVMGRGNLIGERVLSGEEIERRFKIAFEKLARRHGN